MLVYYACSRHLLGLLCVTQHNQSVQCICQSVQCVLCMAYNTESQGSLACSFVHNSWMLQSWAHSLRRLLAGAAVVLGCESALVILRIFKDECEIFVCGYPPCTKQTGLSCVSLYVFPLLSCYRRRDSAGFFTVIGIFITALSAACVF